MAAVRDLKPAYDVLRLREDFPILARHVNGHPLAYLDNAASAQQPAAVIDAVAGYASSHHANVHRGVHTLSQEATALYEGAREKVRQFVNAASAAEIIFVRGTTEAMNLVAQSCGRPQLRPGDEIVVIVAGASLEYRPMAAALRADRGGVARGADRPARRRRLRCLPRAARPAHAHRRARPCVECARHRIADRRIVAAPANVASRRWSTAPRPCRTLPWTCVRSAATSMPSPVTRCTAQPASACFTAASSSSRRCLPGRAAAT